MIHFAHSINHTLTMNSRDDDHKKITQPKIKDDDERSDFDAKVLRWTQNRTKCGKFNACDGIELNDRLMNCNEIEMK